MLNIQRKGQQKLR